MIGVQAVFQLVFNIYGQCSTDAKLLRVADAEDNGICAQCSTHHFDRMIAQVQMRPSLALYAAGRLSHKRVMPVEVPQNIWSRWRGNIVLWWTAQLLKHQYQ